MYGDLIKIRISKDFSKESYLQKYVEGWQNANAIVFELPKKEGIEVWFEDSYFDNIPFLCSVVAHECVHIVSKIYGKRYIKYDTDNDEPQAYLTSWLVENIMYYIEEYKKRKTKK